MELMVQVVHLDQAVQMALKAQVVQAAQMELMVQAVHLDQAVQMALKAQVVQVE
jgi:hypothetical protein